MARKILWLFVFTSAFYSLTVGSVQATPAVTAKAAIIMDATTGEVLYAKDAESRRYPASTTKMMTLLVALEKGRLDDWVVASKAAHETEGSSLYLEAGEKQRLLDLLYGIMLVSGNDATVAVAEHIAGSVPAYARLMTQKAQEIGAVNTQFANSSGLPDPNHYSTAHDLARIAAYGYRTQPLFAEIVSSKRRVMPWPGKGYDREIFNEKFDDYGRKEASELTMKVGGVANVEKHIRTIADGDKIISIDLDMKVANKATLPVKPVNYLNLTDEVRELHKIKEVGTEEILGRKCTKYTLEVVYGGQTTYSTVWIWKGIPLKNETSSNGMVIVTEQATEIQENAEVPAMKFLVPEGVTFP